MVLLLCVARPSNPTVPHASTLPHTRPFATSLPTNSQNEGVDKGDLVGLKIAQGGTQAAQRVGLLCGVDGIDVYSGGCV